MLSESLQYMSTISSSFTSWLIVSNFCSIWIVFHQFFTWITLGAVELGFSPTLARKANATEDETKLAT
jgi:hypothetical protein